MVGPTHEVFALPSRDLQLEGLDALSDTQRARLVDYWRSRTDAEWTTMEALSHVRDDLLALGAPTVLTDLAEHATADEERHCRWCHAMAERVGTQTFRPPQLRGSQRLSFPGAGSAEDRLLRPLFAGCLSESIAVCVLRVNRDEIAPGVIREAQRVHLSDEVSHARLGWAFLAHATQSGWLDSTRRRVIDRTLPAMCGLAKELWSAGDISDDPDLAALGYITRRQIDEGIETAFRDVISPGFARFGFQIEG